MSTPATNSKRKRATIESPAGASKKTKLKPPNFDAPAEMVTFLVGEEKEEFKVHKEFVCHYSPVFAAAFNSSMVEGQTQTYQLEDMRTSAFRLFVKWIYGQNIPLDLDLQDSIVADYFDVNNGPEGNLEIESAACDQDLDLVQLWVAGDRFLIPRLQNEVMLAFNHLWDNDDSSRHPSTGWLSYAYAHTCKGSPLRNIAIDKFVYVVNESIIEERPDDFPHDMLLEMAFTCSKAIQPVEPNVSSAVHREGKLVSTKWDYQCRRTWQSYLVPESE